MGQPQREAIREANAHIEQLHQRMVDQDTLFRRSIAEKDTQIAMLEQQLASRSQLEAALQSAYDTISKLTAQNTEKDAFIGRLKQNFEAIRQLTHFESSTAEPFAQPPASS
eukprot:m.387366 g.387366  ORF g.387366 m.387366 type:complete len:111 (+) comp56314_c0_seq4:1638-1970(+)